MEPTAEEERAAGEATKLEELDAVIMRFDDATSTEADKIDAVVSALTHHVGFSAEDLERHALALSRVSARLRELGNDISNPVPVHPDVRNA